MTTETVEQVPAPLIITEPGLHDVPEDAYHRDPVPAGSLSSSGARMLLPPSCPALFRYEQDHPRDPSPAQAFGTLAHTLVLGSGPELFVYDKLDGRTKAGKEQAAEMAQALASGVLAVPAEDYARAQAMVEEIRKHPLASALFNPENGAPEQSGFWQDRETGAWCRVRYDFLPQARNGRLIFPDFKTTRHLDDQSIDRDLGKWGYHQQLDFYERGAQALGLAESATGVLVFQMVDPPHLVRVVQMDQRAQEVAHLRNRRAIDLFARCQATGKWPGYGDDVHTASLPPWIANQEEYAA